MRCRVTTANSWGWESLSRGLLREFRRQRFNEHPSRSPRGLEQILPTRPRRTYSSRMRSKTFTSNTSSRCPVSCSTASAGRNWPTIPLRGAFRRLAGPVSTLEIALGRTVLGVAPRNSHLRFPRKPSLLRHISALQQEPLLAGRARFHHRALGRRSPRWNPNVRVAVTGCSRLRLSRHLVDVFVGRVR
jgi:hypothetical protein